MKIPPILSLGCFALQKRNSVSKQTHPSSKLNKDTVSFSASTAYYLKKYKTLPDEIKAILKPKDAIDMFRNMENLQKGIQEAKKIGQGNDSKVFENPWLEDYYILISKAPEKTTQIVYSRYELGNSVWQDVDNSNMQIIKKAG